MTTANQNVSGKAKFKRSLQRFLAFLLVVNGVACWTGCSAYRKADRISPFANSPLPTSCSTCEEGNCTCDSQLTRLATPSAASFANDQPAADIPIAEFQPITLSTIDSVQSREMTLDQCVEMALRNSEVMEKLGGVVVQAPGASATLYDPALVETSLNSVESALSDFDAQVAGGFVYNRSERQFNNLFFGGGADNLTTNTSNFNLEVAKQTASGATFTARTLVDYNRSNAPANLFGSAYDIVNQLEFRQSLGRGRGALVNRIAGPNAIPGVYSGVLIGRIVGDISLADFEAAVRDLVRDVENNYWELYFAYRDFDTKVAARDAARDTWENRQIRFENEVGRADDEAQARQQYYTFKSQAQISLIGTRTQPGIVTAERTMRRLMGLPSSDGTLIRPTTEPTVAPVVFDWQSTQQQALDRRVELRRQRWTLKRRELELVAAKALNRWDFDFVGQYGFRGFGDNLFGSRSRTSGSAFDGLVSGELDDWQVGLELSGAIGQRSGHLAIRNAEINFSRERALLQEQQRQILHDLNEAYTEVDSALATIRTAYNTRIAIQEEIEPKRRRVAEGQDQVFFLLDAEQRLATAESAVHRSVADYNRALSNYEYVAGNMLGRFNIRLTEGNWSEDAQANVNAKAGRLTQDGRALYDLPAISEGPVGR